MGNLVLSRRAGESVKIGADTVLTVREVHPAKVYLKCTGDAPFWTRIGEANMLNGCAVTICAITKGIVKLAFEADRSVRIVRTELL